MHGLMSHCLSFWRATAHRVRTMAGLQARQRHRERSMQAQAQTVAIAAAVAAVACIGCVLFASGFAFRRKRRAQTEAAYVALIGNTPMVQLAHLSKVLGREIWVKMESLNPGGTGKDRAALSMISAAEAAGLLRPGGTVVEGTSGSTGISLAGICNAKGYKCVIFMPDDQAMEKRELLRSLGADVRTVKPCAISNPGHYVKQAQKYAETHDNAVFIDQFENAANADIHYATTGPEIWRQMDGDIDAFVMGSGTGGTIAGVSAYLKEQKSSIKVVLGDPEGSSLFSKIVHGVCYTTEQSERKLRRHRYDTIVEGIGLDRVTANLQSGLHLIDDAIRVTDQEAVDMAHVLRKMEGLFVGSSSALNCVAACKVALSLPPNSRVVTVITDSGTRYMSRFWNAEYATSHYRVRWPKNDEEAYERVMASIHGRDSSSDPAILT